jgi:hypothetical protein
MTKPNLGGAVLGIGSLPHTDPGAAVRFVAEYCPEIPFWPQLPQRSAQDDLLLQMLAPVADLLEVLATGRIEVAPERIATLRRRLYSVSARLDETHASGFFAFEQALFAGDFADARLLKGQLYGPLTLARCLYANGCPLYKLPGIYAALTDYLCRLARWQVTRLRHFGKPVLLVVDEPALALEAMNSEALKYVRQVLQAIHEAGASSGIHCCSAAHPATLAELAPDLISFDAHVGLELYLHHAAIQQFVAGGNWLAFGLIPTLLDLSQLAIDDLYARWVGAAIAGDYDLDQLAARSLISATCGLGLLNERSASQSFVSARLLMDRLSQQSAWSCAE